MILFVLLNLPPSLSPVKGEEFRPLFAQHFLLQIILIFSFENVLQYTP